MVNEVESVLNEIRERVRREHQGNAARPPEIAHEAEPAQLILANSQNGSTARESLNRLSAHLTSTSRAWDRLPPLYSNRRGTAARLELWIKARLKSMTRWFTWEQVNFNSAVHHALSETLHALSAYQQELAATRTELRQEAAASQERFERSDQVAAAARTSIEDLTAELRKRAANLEAHNTALEAHSAAIEKRIAEAAAAITNATDQTRAEMSLLARELRESDQQLRDEQRVCFKQLSLEAGEVTVSQDRERRLIEARFDELEKALAKIKK
jgi:hypothetical protein